MSEHHHQAPEETTSPVVEEGVPQEPQEILDEELLESCKQRICPSCDVASEAEEVRLRALAEMENFKKRLQREKDEQTRYATENVLGDLLPTLDNLDLALQYGGQSEACKDMLNGVEMTRKQMVAAYEKLGVTPIDRLGEKFDPNLEEAIMQGTADDGEPGTVCMVLQKGYMMDKTVLRHAMVKVVPD